MYKSKNKRLSLMFGMCALMCIIFQVQVTAQEVAGVDSVKKVEGSWQFYDFTSQKAFSIADTATFTPDFIGSSNEGVNFGKEFNAIIPEKRLRLLGEGNLDTLTYVPAWDGNAPWIDTSWDFTNGTKGAPISIGQLWVVYTSEGLYAAMEITALPGGNFGDTFVFKYKYMSEGGTSFPNAAFVQRSGSEISSTNTGFDFSTQSIGTKNDDGSYQPDFVFVNNEGVNFGNEGSTSLSTTGRRFLLLGEGNIDTVKTVPERIDAAPWVNVSYDFSNGTLGAPISVGQLWAVYTREGKYAVLQITGLPEGNFGTNFTFNYKYQPNGTRTFQETDFNPVSTEEKFIAIESGNSQSANVEQALKYNLSVKITDENQAVVENETVLFRVLLQPKNTTTSAVITPSASTNSLGVASANVMLGNSTGNYEFKAMIESDTTKFVVFTATASEVQTGPIPTTLVISGGQNQTEFLGDTISTSFEIIIIDNIGEPMNGINVTFEEIEKPDGAVSGKFFTPDGIQTNVAATFNNRAYMNYSLGDKAGSYSVKAFLVDYPEVDSVVFNITGLLVKAPLNFNAHGVGGAVKLTWDNAVGATEYKIMRSLNDDNPANASQLIVTRGSQFLDENVNEGETYFYWIASVDRFGNESEFMAGPLSATAPGIGEVLSGTTKLQKIDGAWQFFDFSSQVASSVETNDGFVADIRGTSNEGVNFGREGASGIQGNRIILLSAESLDALAEVPVWTNEAPWIGTSWQFGGTNGQPLSVGQVWGVYTSEGHYAAMEITSVPVNFGTEFSFKYKYQSSGSNQFEEITPVIPTAIQVIAGNMQTIQPLAKAPIALKVKVIGDEEAPAAGVEVSFTVHNNPENAQGFGLSSNSAITNTNGEAEVHFSAGNVEGAYTIRASVEGLEPVDFTITAETAGPPQAVTLLEIKDGFRPNSLFPFWRQSKSENFLRYNLYMKTLDLEFAMIDSTREGQQFSQDTAKIVVDLIPMQEYTFAVTVVNQDGQESEFSNELTGFPVPTPHQPTNVVATAGDGVIQLTWTPNDTTFFDYYYVYSGKDGQQIMPNDTLWSVNDTSVVIGGLENGELYQFYVIAVNRFGRESSFPQKITATPVNSYEEEPSELLSLINGSILWGDVDGDGDLDVLLTGQVDIESDPQTLLYLNEGTGTFTASSDAFVGVINSKAFWFDLNNDGQLDLIYTGQSKNGALTKVYIKEEGAFQDSGLELPALGDGLVSPIDFDLDGDLDILVAGDAGVGLQTILIENLGNGAYNPTSIALEGLTKAAASWGDLNNDGRPDLLISGLNTANEIVTNVYTNDSNNKFTLLDTNIRGVMNGTVGWSDFDLDGDRDILVSGYTNTANTTFFTGLYTNTNGVFAEFYSVTNPQEKSVAEAKSKSLASIGDYDNDGDSDILISTGYEASILKNNRSSVKEEKLNIGIEGSVVWADYDGDGDLDIIATGSSKQGNQSKVLVNKTQIRNTPPTVPTNLIALVSADTVKLSWNNSTDAQTPFTALTYNVRVGSSSGASDVISVNANLTNGKLRVLTDGNAGSNTALNLNNLKNGTYYWQVQAIDNAFAGSMFANEQEFVVDKSVVSNEEEMVLPSIAELEQNYPNPFNPSTTIGYSVPHTANVLLTVYDINGRVVSKLLDTRKSAGKYTVSFDASNLASGLYIYRLQVGATHITKKMTLIK